MEVEKLQLSVPVQPVSNAADSGLNRSASNVSEDGKTDNSVIKASGDTDDNAQEKRLVTARKDTTEYNFMNNDVSYSYNKDINRVVITLTDRDTDKVIKEIPSDKIQSIIKNIRQMSGMLIDAKI